MAQGPVHNSSYCTVPGFQVSSERHQALVSEFKAFPRRHCMPCGLEWLQKAVKRQFSDRKIFPKTTISSSVRQQEKNQTKQMHSSVPWKEMLQTEKIMFWK